MAVAAGAHEGTRRGALVAFFLAGQAVVLSILMGPLLGLPWWRGFRGYFSYDQLAYAAIAANVVHGDTSLDEPYTQTGTSYYPSGWYLLIGWLSRGTGLPVHVVWTVAGVLMVGAAVGAVGWLAYRLSGRSWAPLLPPVLLLTGTLSTWAVGNWYTHLGEHAVLWGPYGTLFTLNAEVAGLSLAAIAVTLLALASRPAASSPRARTRTAQVLVAAALAGLTANVHTYAFFSVVSLSAAFLATRTLMTRRSTARTLTTVGLITTVLLLGPALGSRLGPLPLFVLLLVCLGPAVWPELRAHPRLSLTALVVFAVAGSPQILRTLWGLTHGDPFLTYRQASTSGLGVLYWQALIASLPLLLLFAASAVAVWRSGQSTQASLVIALGSCLIILALNDIWDFDQEPYRFWLEFQILALLFLSAVLAWGMTRTSSMPRPRSAVFAALLLVSVVMWAVGLADLRSFVTFARSAGVIAMDDPRLDAARALLATNPGLVMSSKCTAPGVLKNAIGRPVAAYNKGLAWPPDVKAFEIFTDPLRRASEDPVALRAAGVRYVLTDSLCPDDWAFPASQKVLPLRTRDYKVDGGGGTLTLWWVQPT